MSAFSMALVAVAWTATYGYLRASGLDLDGPPMFAIGFSTVTVIFALWENSRP